MPQPQPQFVPLPWWVRVTAPYAPAAPAGGAAPIDGGGGGPQGFPPGVMTWAHPWWGGWAPQVPPPSAWPQPPSPNVPAEQPAEQGVQWQEPTSAPTSVPEKVAAWAPNEAELTRWGVEKQLNVAAGQNPGAVAPQELTRIELPAPAACVAIVWSRAIVDDPAVLTEAQLVVGIGGISVPVTPFVPLAKDGIGRFLLPSDARAPLATVSLPVVMPVKWMMVVSRLAQGPPAVDASFALGAILAPVSSIF